MADFTHACGRRFPTTRDIGHRGVVVGVLADVLVLGALDTVRRQVLEDVVAVGHFGERAQNSDGSEGLHGAGSQMERMTMCGGSRGCWIADAVPPQTYIHLEAATSRRTTTYALMILI